MRLANPFPRGLLTVLALCCCKSIPTVNEPVGYEGLFEWAIDAGYCIDAPIRGAAHD